LNALHKFGWYGRYPTPQGYRSNSCRVRLAWIGISRLLCGLASGLTVQLIDKAVQLMDMAELNGKEECI